MKTFTILGIGVAILGATAAIAGACDREAKREAMRTVAEASFAEADADASGALTADEFSRFHELLRAQMAAHRFQRADADGDGAVTLAELAESRGRRHRRGPGL